MTRPRRQLPRTVQGCFNVLLTSSAIRTSLLHPTLQEKQKPGEFWHTQSSTNLAERLNRSKESCQPLGLMHAVGQDKRTLGLGSRSHLGYPGTRCYLGCILIYTTRVKPHPVPSAYHPLGSIISRKSALENTRIEVVEPSQSHQSPKNPSWAQPLPALSRAQG